MQALIATSRSVSQDVFLEKQNQRKYKQHIKQVSSIRNFKQFPALDHAKQVQKMSKTIYKYKETAKSFKQQQQLAERKRENRILLQKIWKMNSNLKTDNDVMHLQHQSGSNWGLKRKQSQIIKEENKRFGVQLLTQRTDVKDYKKKLGEQIKEYLQLRKNIRKCTYQQDKNKQLKRAKSQKKGIVLKLHDDQDQNNKQAQDNNKIQKNQQNKKVEKHKKQLQPSRKSTKQIVSQKLNLDSAKRQQKE